jgi:hypothetical protein
MEQELFLSGYCKALDRSRMVWVVIEDGEIAEIDCAYPNCPHSPSCPIGEKIAAAKQA